MLLDENADRFQVVISGDDKPLPKCALCKLLSAAVDRRGAEMEHFKRHGNFKWGQDDGFRLRAFSYTRNAIGVGEGVYRRVPDVKDSVVLLVTPEWVQLQPADQHQRLFAGMYP